MTKKECCICLESETEIEYECGCCKDGKICMTCMSSKGRYGRDIDEDKKWVECPVCRTHNWKYIYSCIIYDLEYICYGNSSYKYQNVWDIFNKNSEI